MAGLNNHTLGAGAGLLSSVVAAAQSDAADLADFGYLYAGGAGNIKVNLIDGSTITMAVVAGSWTPFKVSRVWVTDTTATGLFVGW